MSDTIRTGTPGGVQRPATPDIEHHAAIGDCETIALVSCHGDIDWMCWPRADSPSVFGALLDPDAGYWLIRPTCEVRRSVQFYVPATNVAVTRFQTADGLVEIDDAMTLEGPRRLIRRVRCVSGRVEVATDARFRPGYGRATVESTQIDERTCEITSDGMSLVLAATAGDLTTDGSGNVSGRVTIDQGDSVLFELIDDDTATEADELDSCLTATIDWWKDWSARSNYRGRYRDAVQRSALALKLLTNRRTGGVLAAATTSLPERIGGDRNWDYRYVWIRDAAFTIYALLELGYTEEADGFVDWLLDLVEDCETSDQVPLTPLYDLDGNAKVDETTLEWAGYEHSAPVRLGNRASGQLQLDIYGELLDSLYLIDHHVRGLSLNTWDKVTTIVDYVIDHWEQPDAGMWESRGEPRRHTSAVLMCWVAVERAIRMARFRGRPADLVRWSTARDEMHRFLREECWNDDVGAFVQTAGGQTLDGSILLAPLVKFVDGHDPQWLSTLDAVLSSLAHGPLVDRYDTSDYDDGVGGDEGAFTICSFWLVEALARAGRVADAEARFDQLLGFASPVGLFSEQIGANGRQLGNTPQALTHLSLISAAVALDEALDGRYST